MVIKSNFHTKYLFSILHYHTALHLAYVLHSMCESKRHRPVKDDLIDILMGLEWEAVLVLSVVFGRLRGHSALPTEI